MIKWFQNHSLKFKVVTVMAVIIVIYSVVFSAYTLSSAKKQTQKQLENTHAETLRQFNNYVDNLQRNVINFFSSAYVDEAVMKILSSPNPDLIDGTDSRIHTFLLRTLLMNEDLTFGGFCNENELYQGQYVSINNSFGLLSYDAFRQSPIIQDFDSHAKAIACYRLEKADTSILARNQNDQLLFLHKLRNPRDDFNEIGYFLLGTDVSALEKNIASVVDTCTGGMLILDAQGQFLYQCGDLLGQDVLTDISTGQEYLFKNNAQYLVHFTQNNVMGWKLYYYQTVRSDYLLTPLITIIFVFTGALVVFIIMAWLATSAITAPINKLLASIQKFQQGDFDQHVDITYPDEIGQVTEGYNLIVTRIRELIRQNYEIKIHEQQAQLAALETQINPHFLYNTLDLLFWKAIAYQQTEISDIIRSLSKIFRISLNRGNSFISYEKELEFLTCYLQVQTRLMSDTLRFDIFCDDTLKGCYLPRFVLQPFIENAIIHAFSEGKSDPCIQIDMRREADMARIEIADNGCGMTQAQIETILQQQPNNAADGYAIFNVLTRLKLYYGYHMKFDIHSAAQEGTRVILQLPVRLLPLEKGEADA